MKKGIFSVVFLLAISSVMAAMSFSSAAVKSDMDVTVKNSNESLLALVASAEHNAADYKANGELLINLNKGNGADYGVQNNSKYNWDKLFAVKNNSDKDINVTVNVAKRSGKGTFEASEVTELDTFGKPGGGHGGGGIITPTKQLLKLTNGGGSNTLSFTLKPGKDQEIDLELLTNNIGKGSNNYTLTVDAVRTDGK